MGVNRAALARQHEAAQQALLECLLGLLAAGRTEDVSFRELAEAAGVSERTVYRYFDRRETLCEAVVPLAHARLAWIGPPDDPEGILDYVERLYRVCEDNAGLVRSLLHTSMGQEILRGVRAERVEAHRVLVEKAAPAASPERIQAAGATLRHIASGAAWDFYRFQAGLSLDQAVAAARWAVGSLLKAAAEPDRA